MSEERFTVGAGAGRLDKFLADKLSDVSRAHCRALVEKGRVTVDGRVKSPAYKLRGGEVVSVRIGDADWVLPAFDKWILHEDKDILVLHKPSGIVCHPVGESWLKRPEAVLDDTEATLAGILWHERPEVRTSGVERCGLIHRLDRQTSGVLVTAKRPKAQKALLKGFRERSVKKVYRAIVVGRLSETKVDAPIGRLPGRRKVQVSPWGKDAKTEFKTVEFAKGMSLVEARPKTGRTHQIRAHLALLGHPVVGDHEWFKDEENAALKRLGHQPPSRMMLHAYRLRFTHPTSEKTVSYTGALPADFKNYWKSFK